VPLDLLDGVERDADHDEQARAAEVERHVEVAHDEWSQHADRGQVQGAAEGDEGEHLVDVLGRLLARADAGM
jgi:hypothetical protein